MPSVPDHTLLFQVLRKTTKFEIKDEAIFTIAEVDGLRAMFIYLFFTIAELFKEFYSNIRHIVDGNIYY